ncbi:MAG: DUF3810 family protein, partial [Myxococcales bacterium]|nr:DUF3810 family protein [Myxococcales bacterium]
MGTQSLYVDVDDDVLRPRTDTPCADAPQQGIHLFHYPKSLCSQKVRQLLDEKGVAWTSHVVQLPLEAQYEPAYVRINPRCVVPTLVRDGKVTTDSMNILRFADAALPGPALTPASASARACVDRFLASADGLFLEVLTYGEIPGVRKPLLMRRAAKGTHAEKLARLDAKLREHGDDPRLRAAYARLGERVPALAGGGMLLRKPLSAPLLSRLGITGIFSPFTGEAHVNDRTRPWLHLFSAAHELAHQKGFARED